MFMLYIYKEIHHVSRYAGGGRRRPRPCHCSPRNSVTYLYISSNHLYISIYLSIYLSLHLPIYLSFFLSIYLSIYLYIYVYIYISMSLSLSRSLANKHDDDGGSLPTCRAKGAVLLRFLALSLPPSLPLPLSVSHTLFLSLSLPLPLSLSGQES